MPEKATIGRARKKARQRKSPSTQAGEFVREEIHHIREGKHGARSAKQAIAIGLSKARRAGVKLPPRKGDEALRHEPRSSASHTALARQAHAAAIRRGAAGRHAAAKKAAYNRGRRQHRTAR